MSLIFFKIRPRSQDMPLLFYIRPHSQYMSLIF